MKHITKSELKALEIARKVRAKILNEMNIELNLKTEIFDRFSKEYEDLDDQIKELEIDNP